MEFSETEIAVGAMGLLFAAVFVFERFRSKTGTRKSAPGGDFNNESGSSSGIGTESASSDSSGDSGGGDGGD